MLNNLQAQQKLLSGKPGDTETSASPRGLGLPGAGALNPLNTSQLSNSNNNIKDFFSRHSFNKNKVTRLFLRYFFIVATLQLFVSTSFICHWKTFQNRSSLESLRSLDYIFSLAWHCCATYRQHCTCFNYINVFLYCILLLL